MTSVDVCFSCDKDMNVLKKKYVKKKKNRTILVVKYESSMQ